MVTLAPHEHRQNHHAVRSFAGASPRRSTVSRPNARPVRSISFDIALTSILHQLLPAPIVRAASRGAPDVHRAASCGVRKPMEYHRFVRIDRQSTDALAWFVRTDHIECMETIKTTRKAPGFYTATIKGVAYEICGGCGPDANEWIWKRADARDADDLYPTKRAALEALADWTSA